MSFSKTKQLLLGISAVSGVALYSFNTQKSKVNASWTTNHTPNQFSKWDYNWDHRHPDFAISPKEKENLTEQGENMLNEKREKLKVKACRHIIMIRHGQYNLKGETDQFRKLTDLGRTQADFTGKRLKELAFPYTDMVVSTMTRARETGGIIAKSLPDVPVEYCDLLREGAPIPPEPSSGNWKPEMYKFFQDGSRIEAAFRKYFHRASPDQEEDSYTILVCHANVIRYFVCRALQFPPEAWLRLSLNNASITWISITPRGRCILRALGDAGHMPSEVLTTT